MLLTLKNALCAFAVTLTMGIASNAAAQTAPAPGL